jgi:electron transport complex, RnfABCDGE type, G subunit
MKEIIKLGLILFLISAVAAAALGFVNAVTKGPIEAASKLADTQTRKVILSDADDFKSLEISSPDKYPLIREIYQGSKGGDTCGYTFKTVPKGYGGTIEVLIGIDTQGTVTGVDIGNQNETPGLGTKAKDEKFKGQYTGKNAQLSVIKSGTPKDDEISAISGATISSRAVTSGVNEALKYYQENLKDKN